MPLGECISALLTERRAPSSGDNDRVRPFLRALGGLPVWRRMDDPALVHRNEETFRAAILALREGHAVQIYPEGRSHSEPALAPLTAWIAMRRSSSLRRGRVRRTSSSNWDQLFDGSRRAATYF